MVVYRRDTRGRSLLLILCVVALALISIDSGGSSVISSLRSRAHDVLSPVQSVTNSAFQPLRDVAGGITSYSSVKDQNAQLRKQVADLRGQLRRNKGFGSQIGALEKLLDLPTAEDATGIVARVTGGAPGNFERTVQIDKGSSKGIRNGYPVVTGDGLVGTVTQVSTGQATVTLMDSPTLGIGVYLAASNTTAITSAKAGDRTLTLTNLSDPRVKATKGEVVFTAPVPGAAFPADIPVGTVASSTRAPQDLQPTITVNPLVNLDNLGFVKVLRFPDPTATPGG